MTADAPVPGHVRLVPADDEAFDVQAPRFTLATQEQHYLPRARVWATRQGVLLVTGVAACVHGLYGMLSCPGDVCRDLAEGWVCSDVWLRRRPDGSWLEWQRRRGPALGLTAGARLS